MWKKPNESLDDFIVKPASEVEREAPRPVSLRGTGDVEVLTPLTPPVRSGRYDFKAPFQPLWFRRFLAVGSGALVMIAFVLVSAILVGINDSPTGPEVATNEMLDAPLSRPEEPYSLNIASFASPEDEADIVRSTSRRRASRPTVQLAVNRPRRQLRPPLQPDEPNFVPTTLVIYAENGSINTRVEPWFQTGDKKTTTFNN
jgi:hypothetical protein